MNSINKFTINERGRVDFRVPDGQGRWCYPDWGDNSLKVEIYDEGGVLRLTATTGTEPGLVKGDDYDEKLNPEGGKFVAIQDIPLTDFALGNAEAFIYAKVSGVSVLPYPTVLFAFKVVTNKIPEEVKP